MQLPLKGKGYTKTWCSMMMLLQHPGVSLLVLLHADVWPLTLTYYTFNFAFYYLYPHDWSRLDWTLTSISCKNLRFKIKPWMMPIHDWYFLLQNDFKIEWLMEGKRLKEKEMTLTRVAKDVVNASFSCNVSNPVSSELSLPVQQNCYAPRKYLFTQFPFQLSKYWQIKFIMVTIADKLESFFCFSFNFRSTFETF